MEVSVIKIGNSKEIRLSKTLLDRYNIQDTVEIILEKPLSRPRKGWEKAFKRMSENGNDRLLNMNEFYKTVVIAPMTTSSRNYPTRIEVRQDKKTGHKKSSSFPKSFFL